jgi:hypothetical protein
MITYVSIELLAVIPTDGPFGRHGAAREPRRARRRWTSSSCC